ncbi:unnamed protein product, partial [Amoebophrya sp. A25]
RRYTTASSSKYHHFDPDGTGGVGPAVPITDADSAFSGGGGGATGGATDTNYSRCLRRGARSGGPVGGQDLGLASIRADSNKTSAARQGEMQIEMLN